MRPAPDLVLRTDVRISGPGPAHPLTLEVARFHGGGDHNTTAPTVTSPKEIL